MWFLRRHKRRVSAVWRNGIMIYALRVVGLFGCESFAYFYLKMGQLYDGGGDSLYI
jgi:hypothetical protein